MKTSFAGHCDSRLPTIGELAGIVDPTQYLCLVADGQCIDQIVFGPTFNAAYWSAGTVAAKPDVAWFVDFAAGDVGNVAGYKSLGGYVRGVRSGL